MISATARRVRSAGVNSAIAITRVMTGYAGSKCRQCPSGEIVPRTSVQASDGTNIVHSEQWSPSTG